MTVPVPLLLDENFSIEIATSFRAMGFDVTTAADEGLRGRDDSEIIERARSTTGL